MHVSSNFKIKIWNSSDLEPQATVMIPITWQIHKYGEFFSLTKTKISFYHIMLLQKIT